MSSVRPLVECPLRQARQPPGRGRHIDINSPFEYPGALAGSVAEDHERTLRRTECRKTAAIDHLGRHLALRVPLRIEDLRIDLHAPGIDHRAEQRPVPIRHGQDARLVVLAGYLGQRIERPDSHQRLPQPVAQALGERNADAQSRIGAGALADGHGIQIVGRDACFVQQFIDEHADLTRMVAPLVALAQRDQFAILRNTHRTYVGSGFDTQYQAHIFVFFIVSLSFSAPGRQMTPKCSRAFRMPSSSTDAVTQSAAARASSHPFPHGDADPCGPQHGHIVSAVADGHQRPGRHPAVGGEGKHPRSLVHPADIDVHEERAPAARHKRRQLGHHAALLLGRAVETHLAAVAAVEQPSEVGLGRHRMGHQAGQFAHDGRHAIDEDPSPSSSSASGKSSSSASRRARSKSSRGISRWLTTLPSAVRQRAPLSDTTPS